MTDQKPFEPAEERKPSPEELAVLRAGKEEVERAKMAIGQPIPMMTDANWLLSEEGQPVLAHALGRDARGEPRPVSDARVTVMIPHDFVFHATHHHRFNFLRGVREIPASLLDIKYIRDNGVKPYERPAPQVQTILGSNSLGPEIRVGGAAAVPSGPFVTQAFQESGMTVDQWNSLSDEERGTRAIDCATKAEAARAADHAKSSGSGVPGAGAGSVRAQPSTQPPPNKIAPGPRK